MSAISPATVLEARIVAIVFTDLVGSTALLDAVGEDEAERVRRNHFRLLRRACHAHGGRDVKNTGDGLMLVFASAIEAVSASVLIQRTIDRANQAGTDVPVEARIGIHVGEPIQAEDDYFGAPAVVARRLCDDAEGGEILVSDLVTAIVDRRGRFRFGPPEPRMLKGLGDPVIASRVVWSTEDGAPTPPPLLAQSGADFVGRGRELALLRERWAAAAGGRAHACLVTGEPGIGKTRLVSELAVMVDAGGGLVIAGRCREDGAAPYEPFVEGFHRVVASSADHDRSRLLSAAGPWLGRLLPDLVAPPPASSPESDRFLVFEAVRQLLEELCRDRPSLLVIDDLHWAGDATIGLLRHLVEAFDDQRLLVVATSREDRDAGASTAAWLTGRTGGTRLPLAGLETDDIDQLARQHGGVPGAVGPEPGPTLRRITGGNPFFVRELLRHAHQYGTLDDVPGTVGEVVRARLAELSPESRRLLEAAAVIGHEFEVDVATTVAALAEPSALDAIEEAAAAHLVEEVEDGLDRFRFAHAIVRDALYDDLTTLRRRRCHRAVALTLEQRPGGLVSLSDLAHHWASADDPTSREKALTALQAAAADAAAQAAFDEAATYLSVALELLERPSPSPTPAAADLAALHLDLGRALANTERSPEARAHFELVALEARARGDAGLLADAALGLGSGGVRAGAVDLELADLLDEALTRLPAADVARRVAVAGRLTTELFFSGSPDRPLALATQAVAEARASGEADLLATGFHALHLALFRPQHLAERAALAEEWTEVASRAADPEAEMWAHLYRLVDLLQLEQVDRARDVWRAYEAVTSAMRPPRYLWWAVAVSAAFALLEGKFDEAEKLIDVSRIEGERWGDPNLVQSHAAQLLALRWEQARLAELEPIVIAFAAEDPPVAAWQAALALVQIEAGRTTDAIASLDRLVRAGIGGIPGDSLWLTTASLAAEVAYQAGSAEHAGILRDTLAPYADQSVVVATGAVALGAASRFVGLAAAATGDVDGAILLLQDALHRNRGMGARPAAARAAVELAEVLSRRDEPGDGIRASRLAAEGGAEATALGMEAVARRARIIRPASN